MPKQITFTFTGSDHEDFVDAVFTWEAAQNASETEDDEFVDEYVDLTPEEIAQLDYEWARYGVTVADLREWNKKYPHGQ